MMINTEQQGMVLLTTIIMMAIMTLLLLSLMQSTLLSLKVSNQVIKNQNDLHPLEVIAYRLAIEKVGSECVLTGVNPNEMVPMVLHGGCELKDHDNEYRYLVDDLGLFPCFERVLGKNVYSKHHLIITVAKKQAMPLLLQLRVAKLVKSLACEGEIRHARGEVVSWRYLVG